MRPNNCLSFDGDDEVDCGSDTSFDVTNGLTVALLVRITTEEVAARVIHRCNRNFEITRETGPKFRFLTKDTGDAVHHAIADDIFNLLQWYFLVGTYDGATQYFYIDKVRQVASAAWVGNIKTGGTVFIGSGGASSFLKGDIDEVLIYNRAWDQDEVTYNYNGGLGTLEPYSREGLVAHWHMDEGTGLYIQDKTTYDNVGTITGATWTTGFPFRPVYKVPRRARV